MSISNVFKPVTVEEIKKGCLYSKIVPVVGDADNDNAIMLFNGDIKLMNMILSFVYAHYDTDMDDDIRQGLIVSRLLLTAKSFDLIEKIPTPRILSLLAVFTESFFDNFIDAYCDAYKTVIRDGYEAVEQKVESGELNEQRLLNAGKVSQNFMQLADKSVIQSLFQRIKNFMFYIYHLKDSAVVFSIVNGKIKDEVVYALKYKGISQKSKGVSKGK
jgi:hypothetical protein